MVANPLGGTGVEIERGKETCADGGQDSACEHEGSVVAEFGDETAGYDGPDDNSQEDRNIPDARLIRVDTLDGLEPDGEVIDCHKEGGPHEESKSGCGPYATLAER